MQYVFNTENCKRYQFPTHRNDLVIDRADSKTSEVFVVYVEPGKAVHFHEHGDCEQIFYIIEGEGVLEIGPDKNEYAVKPTQVVRIPAGTLHSIRPAGEKPIRYLAIDCFYGDRKNSEQSWDDHVRSLCNKQGWDLGTVIDDTRQT